MTPRRILTAAVVGLAALGVLGAPNASADPSSATNLQTSGNAACAWALDEGVCVSNPFDDLPDLPLP
jgi:hypothetical protein